MFFWIAYLGTEPFLTNNTRTFFHCNEGRCGIQRCEPAFVFPDLCLLYWHYRWTNFFYTYIHVTLFSFWDKQNYAGFKKKVWIKLFWNQNMLWVNITWGIVSIPHWDWPPLLTPAEIAYSRSHWPKNCNWRDLGEEPLLLWLPPFGTSCHWRRDLPWTSWPSKRAWKTCTANCLQAFMGVSHFGGG